MKTSARAYGGSGICSGPTLETGRLVEVHRVGEFGVAAQEQGGRAEPASALDRRLDELAAEALATHRRDHRHLRQLEDVVRVADQGDTADDLPAVAEDQHVAARGDDGGERVAERLAVGLFDGEEMGDPFFVQRPEGLGLLRACLRGT